MAPTAPPPRPQGRARRPLALAAGAALALGAAFVAGRCTGAPPPPSAPAAPTAVVPAAPPPGAAAAPVPAQPAPPSADAAASPSATASGPAAPPAGPSTLRTPLPPDALEQVRGEVAAGLEARRREDLARCWPRAGLPKGQPHATVLYDLTFDPAGREVARGISDDRRAPAGELGRCLSRAPGAALSIAPRGTYVSLRVAVTYP